MIDSTYFFVIVMFMAIGTFAIRSSFIAISGKLKNSEKLREFFSYIPAAILPGFIIPAVFFHQGSIDFLAGKERLAVLVFSGIVFFFIRSTFLIIAVGLIALYLITN